MRNLLIILIAFFTLTGCKDDVKMKQIEEDARVRIAQSNNYTKQTIAAGKIAYKKEFWDKTYKFFQSAFRPLLIFAFLYGAYKVIRLIIERSKEVATAYLIAKVEITRYRTIEALAASGQDIKNIDLSGDLRLLPPNNQGE